MIRATTVEELQPLLALCRAGRLFEVQAWIAQGKPVALPEAARTRSAQHNPLRVAMDTGFHSLVQVLLEAGVPPREGRYDALRDAVEQRRPDLASLLIEHGADVADVSMRLVLEMWQPEVVELFLANGASLVRDRPIAWGLINRTRPTLGLLKRFSAEQPELMRQAELALRLHAREGHAQGVALMLWAGADPWARGTDWVDEPSDDEVSDDEVSDDEMSDDEVIDDEVSDDEVSDDEVSDDEVRDEDEVSDEEARESEERANAVELAIYHGHLDILRQKKLLAAIAEARVEQVRLLEIACHTDDGQVLSLLLERGYTPTLLPDLGTRAIASLLHSMSWEIAFRRRPELRARGIDTDRAREKLRMLHMLLAAGARWLPADTRAISDARRCLLKMAPAYALEFVWLMQAYGAARRREVQELLRTGAMVRLLAQDRERAASLVARIPEGSHTNSPPERRQG